MSEVITKLPESVTSIFESTEHTKCRVAWQYRTGTKKSGGGEWFGLENEDNLKETVDIMNAKYKGLIDHWMEYM